MQPVTSRNRANPWGLLCGVLLLSAIANANAGEFNPVLSIGDPGPAWAKLPGVDGKSHSLADLDKKFVVVVFTCNSCPYAVDYEDRIIAFAKKYAEVADVVAINVNRIPEDSLPRMKERAADKGFPFPYLYDESQQIARDYGAIYTPEFFVLDSDRKVVYMGGIDDNSDASAVTERYLEAAMDALLAGKQPPTAETVARGCRIRFERQRRRPQK